MADTNTRGNATSNTGTGEAHAHEPLSYSFLTGIWVGLMARTAVTVGVARVDLGYLNILVALGVASCKACLVIFFFMHLKYENLLLKGCLLYTSRCV